MPVLGVAGGLSHPVAQRHPDRPALRIVTGLLLGVMTYLVLLSVITDLVLVITQRVTGNTDPYQAYRARAIAGELPEGLLATNLAIGSLILVCWALMRWINLAPAGLLVSVVRRIRWGYLLACAGVALLVFGAIQAASLSAAGTVLRPQPQFWWFVLVIVLTSPFQAAAEEVFFRGFLQQGLGSATGRWWIGVLGSALLFALAHGVQSPALFVDRLAFGVVAGLVVWRTGGLEAGIGTHIVNNVMAFVLAGLTSSIAEARGMTVIGWDKALVDVATFTAIAAGCWLVATRMRLARVTPDSGLGDRAIVS